MAMHDRWRFRRDNNRDIWVPLGMDMGKLTLWWEAKHDGEPFVVFKKAGRSEWVSRGQPGEWFPTEFVIVKVIAREEGLIHGEIMFEFPTSEQGRRARWAGDGRPQGE